MGVTLGPTFLLGSTFPPGSALPVPGSAGPPRGLFHLFLPWELPRGCPGAPPAGPVLPVGQEVLFRGRGSGFARQAPAHCQDRDDGVGILLSSLPRCPGRAVPVGAAPWAMPPQCPAENPPKDSVNTCGAAPAAPRGLSLPLRFPAGTSPSRSRCPGLGKRVVMAPVRTSHRGSTFSRQNSPKKALVPEGILWDLCLVDP